MALDVKVGSFIKTIEPEQVLQSVTGLGFQPKAILLWGTRLDSDTIAAGGFIYSMGFASSPSDQYSQGIFRIVGSDTRRMSNRRCFLWGDVAGGVAFVEAELISFDADGFTLNWVGNDLTAAVIHYLALGGDDLIAAQAGSFQQPAGAGSQSVVAPGLQPDAIIMLNAGLAVFDETVSPGSPFSVGACDGNLNQRSASLLTYFPVAAFNQRSQLSGVVTRWSSVGAGVREGTITAMTASGFDIDWDVGGTANYFGYLALKGPQFHVGDADKPTAPGQVATTGIGFNPLALFLWSYCDGVTFQRDIDDAPLAVGAGDGTTEGSTWIGVRRSPLAIAQATDRTKILQMWESSHAPSGIDGEADLQSLDSDGFTLDWPVADATARKFLYLAIGAAPLPGEPTFISTNPVSPNESNTPFIIGSADPGSTVQLYTDASCTVPIGAPTPAADFASPGIQVTVPDWSTTTFHAIATDAIGSSPCSSDSITYVNLVPSVVIGLLAICNILGQDSWALISPSGFLQILETFIDSGFVPDPDAEKPTLEDMVKEITLPDPSGFRRDPQETHLWDL